MTGLILGLLLWSAVHLIPSLARPFRARLIERLDPQKYQGLFALAILCSVLLMVFGWRSTIPSLVYVPPAWGRVAANILMLVALALFIGSAVETNIKRVIRHPQLLGVATWAFGHLLANGESRSILLFGGIGTWAIVAMFAINRRDGEWIKPEPVPVTADLKPVAVAIVAYLVLLFVHPWIAGVSASAF